MDFVLSVLLGMVAMAVIDLPVIKYVINPTLQRTGKHLIAKKPDALSAIIFYVLYVTLVVFLSQELGETTWEVTYYGALLGLLAYGTYEFTNKAVLSGWSWRMVAIDTVWGTILTASIAAVASLV